MECCPLCTSKLTVSFLKAPALDVSHSRLYEYMLCESCDVIILCKDCKIKDDTVDYSNSGYYSREDNKAKSFIRVLTSLFSLLRLNIVKKFINNKTLEGLNILDIGCGKGGFLEAAKKQGAMVHGLEPTERSFEVAKNKLGQSVQNLMMSKSIFPNNSMDVITMWHVFEHIPMPKDILNDCNYVLKNNGLLVIAIPNYRGLIAKLGGRVWFNLDPPRHVVHYSEKALRKVVENSGFTVINVTHDYAELTYFSFLQTLLNLLPISKNFLFNYLKRNYSALPRNCFTYIMSMSATMIFGVVLLPIVIIMTPLASFIRSSDCITLVAKKNA